MYKLYIVYIKCKIQSNRARINITITTTTFIFCISLIYSYRVFTIKNLLYSYLTILTLLQTLSLNDCVSLKTPTKNINIKDFIFLLLLHIFWIDRLELSSNDRVSAVYWAVFFTIIVFQSILYENLKGLCLFFVFCSCLYY